MIPCLPVDGLDTLGCWAAAGDMRFEHLAGCVWFLNGVLHSAHVNYSDSSVYGLVSYTFDRY